MKFKPDWFLPAMVLVTVLAWAYPEPGAAGGWMQPALLNRVGVSLLFFLHGVALSFAAMRAGALNWRLHVVIQACTYVMFPLLGLALNGLLGGHVSDDIKLGIFFLCALPSTVATSVAMTAEARGNVAGAVFNATLSSLIGVLLTPMWITLVLKTTGEARPMGPVILDLIRWLVLPLVVGQLLRPWLGAFVQQHKKRITFVDRGTILLLVYTSFCDSFAKGIWSGNGAGQIILLTAICLSLFILVLVLTSNLSRLLRLTRPDKVAVVFCGSKKTLAAGVPMAKVIFGAHPALGLILLPLMIYHSLQLVIGGVLAQRWGAHASET